MAFAHRDGDKRACDANTIVSGQNFVTIDGKLWSVDGDNNTDGGGALQHTQSYITIGGIYAILVGDHASPDGKSPDIIDGGLTAHDDPIATGSDNFVDVS
jgi:uncharacterized Zn-binding protein involved in type VI secretion